MKSPSVTRLVFFTIAVLTGTGLIFADRMFLVGLFLVCFSNVIVMSKGERENQKKKWTTPLTQWQILRGFLPLFVILGVLGYFLSTDTYTGNSSTLEDADEQQWNFGLIWAWTFKTVFLIAVVFLIAQPWMRWYRTRN